MERLKRFFATGPDAPALADAREVDRLYRRSRRSVMLAITLGYGLAYTCRLPLSVVKKPLLDAGIFDAEQLGFIGSTMLYTYGFGKLFNGFFADHANMRRFFAAGLFCSALLNVAMGLSPALVAAWAVLWAVNGWFQGFGAPTAAVSLTNWYSNRERGTWYGIWSTAHAIGEGLTFFITAAVVTWLGWRAGFWAPGLLCIAAAVWISRTLLDRPQTLGLPAIADWKNDHASAANAEHGLTRGRAQLLVLRSPAIWVMGLSNAALYVARYGINSWGVLYLQEERGYALASASLFMTINTVAGVAGSAAFGLMSDRWFRAQRPPVNVIFGVMEIGALAVVFLLPGGHPILMGIAFAAYGFSLSGVLASLGGLFAMDVAPKKAAGAAMGVIGVFGYLGAAVQDQVSGYLIKKSTTVVDGVRHYDFTQPAIFWVAASVVSLLLAASLWRVRARD